MTLEASVLRANAVQATPDGYTIDVHLPWYRSLPLSCLEDVTVSLAGETADSGDLRVRRGERDLTLADLPDLVDDQWFVQDPLQVVVADESPVPAGGDLDIEVTLAVRIPYIIIGPQTALVQRIRVERKVVVQ